MKRLFRPKLTPWPNPQVSLGIQIDTGTRRMEGASAWFPTGPAQQQYDNFLRRDIEALLANSESAEGAPLFLNLYMIGKSEEKANPIVMVCCVNERARKQAEALIRDSNLLERFPGFGLGSSALPLEAGDVLLHVGSKGFVERPFVQQKASLLETATSPPHNDEQLERRQQVIISSHRVNRDPTFNELRIGREIRIDGSPTGSQPRVVTGGPIIVVGNSLYQLTAAHEGQAKNEIGTGAHASDLDDCVFDLQSDEEDAEQVSTSRGSLSPRSSLGHVDDACTKYDYAGSSAGDTPVSQIPLYPLTQTALQPAESFLRDNSNHEHHNRETSRGEGSTAPYSTEGSCEKTAAQLDYTLVELSEEEESQADNTVRGLLHGKQSSTQVTRLARFPSLPITIAVVTRGGVISGTISGWSAVKTDASSGFQKMCIVMLSSPVVPGDSGSALIDPVDGSYYGQIIFGVKGHAMAYALPAPLIFADIWFRFGQLPSFWTIDSKKAVLGHMHSIRTDRAAHQSIASHAARQDNGHELHMRRNSLPLRPDLGVLNAPISAPDIAGLPQSLACGGLPELEEDVVSEHCSTVSTVPASSNRNFLVHDSGLGLWLYSLNDQDAVLIGVGAQFTDMIYASQGMFSDHEHNKNSEDTVLEWLPASENSSRASYSL